MFHHLETNIQDVLSEPFQSMDTNLSPSQTKRTNVTAGFNGHLLRVPGCARGDICESPGCLELQYRLIIHRQKGDKAGQQTSVYDVLHWRFTLLRKQLPA